MDIQLVVTNSENIGRQCIIAVLHEYL